MDFMRNWTFSKEGGESIRVDLPHDAMLSEKRTYATPNGEKTGYYPGGKYEYTKSFTLTQKEADGYVAIAFGGVYGRTTVLLNGEAVCSHVYGYTGFTADLTGHCVSGPNTVKVIADNTLVPNCRWYTGSGIYRTVELIKKPKVHLENVRITTIGIDPAIVRIDCSIPTARVTVLDASGATVASGGVGELEIPNAVLWDAENPSLYTFLIETDTDSLWLKYGIRKLEWSAVKGLRVNHSPVKLRGGCIHHDNGVLGACSFRDAERRKIRLLKDAGYNAVRCSHSPCSKELLEACDELGMYVLDEAFDGWYIPKNYHDYSRAFRGHYREDLQAMVRRDYNHPSVILYSIGNEVTEIADAEGVETAKALVRCIKEVDTTRPVTCGINLMLALMAKNGMGLYKDDKPYEEKELPPLAGSAPKAGSEFFNNLLQKLGSLMAWQNKTEKATQILDSVADALDIVGLNYAQVRYDLDAKTHPERILLGTETLVGDLAYNWPRVEKYDALIGDFCWTAMDYLGEAGLGAWRYEKDSGMPYLAGSGALDITGVPNAENAYQKVIWGLEEIGIGVRPVNHPAEKLIPRRWSFTNAVESWNWKDCDGCPAVVEVYSKAFATELVLNGVSLGKRKVKNNRCLFHCRYQPGTLKAVTYDSRGNVLAQRELSSGKGSTHLQIRAEQEEICADGQSLCYLFVETVDEDGILCPSAEEDIEVSVSGAACLQGIGTARPYSDASFGDPQQKLYLGRCQIVLRAGTQPGEAAVTVTAKQRGEMLTKICHVI